MELGGNAESRFYDDIEIALQRLRVSATSVSSESSGERQPCLEGYQDEIRTLNKDIYNVKKLQTQLESKEHTIREYQEENKLLNDQLRDILADRARKDEIFQSKERFFNQLISDLKEQIKRLEMDTITGTNHISASEEITRVLLDFETTDLNKWKYGIKQRDLSDFETANQHLDNSGEMKTGNKRELSELSKVVTVSGKVNPKNTEIETLGIFHPKWGDNFTQTDLLHLEKVETTRAPEKLDSLNKEMETVPGNETEGLEGICKQSDNSGLEKVEKNSQNLNTSGKVNLLKNIDNWDDDIKQRNILEKVECVNQQLNQSEKYSSLNKCTEPLAGCKKNGEDDGKQVDERIQVIKQLEREIFQLRQELERVKGMKYIQGDIYVFEQLNDLIDVLHDLIADRAELEDRYRTRDWLMNQQVNSLEERVELLQNLVDDQYHESIVFEETLSEKSRNEDNFRQREKAYLKEISRLSEKVDISESNSPKQKDSVKKVTFSNSISQTKKIVHSDFSRTKIYRYLILIGGDYSCGCETTQSTCPDVYNVGTSSWDQLPPLPLHTSRCAIVKLNDVPAIVVLGGYSSQRCLSQVQLYHCVTKDWQILKPLRKPRWGASAVAVEEGFIVMGGCQEGCAMKDVELYQNQKGTWTQLQPMLFPRCNLGCAVVGSTVFVMGGGTENHFVSAINEVEIFDMRKRKWKSVISLRHHRFGCACVVWKERIIVVGGVDKRGQEVLPIDILDANRRKWTELTRLPVPFPQCNAAVFDSKLVVLNTSDYRKEIHAYDLSNQTWEVWAQTPWGKCGFSSLMIGF